ncbi:hypothetical protein Sxan_15030 [Streptomyces xanthophaeus]|uniref:Uncharacterized protein n=1 Tax=Streptomyces xanthophaeus TaxID=67385 RepID=A0A919LH69_9ACTN|nr:hypothetical protein Sxan_15030 [Streptomyces xanthophaeus]
MSKSLLIQLLLVAILLGFMLLGVLPPVLFDRLLLIYSLFAPSNAVVVPVVYVIVVQAPPSAPNF